MSDDLAGMLDWIDRERAAAERARFREDITAYARESHGIWLWKRQRQIAEAVVRAPHRVMVESANGVGKTLMNGLMIAWFHDCYDPGVGICTAPNFEQIKRTTFKEARRMLAGRPGLLPTNPEIHHHPNHYFTGYTARNATGFQGVHDAALMLLFEEATGIPLEFWTAARSMIAGGDPTFWVASLNPTDSTSAAKAESDSGEFVTIRISAFEHPNVLAGLCGLPEPINGAVRLGYSEDGHKEALLSNMAAWGERDCPYSHERTRAQDVDLHDPATYGFESPGERIDVHPDGTTVAADEVVAGAKRVFPARYWRPGPEGEARIGGRYPSQATHAIFSEAALRRAFGRDPEPVWTEGIVGGCDCGHFGDDPSELHIRVGMSSYYHEERSRQSTTETAGWIKQVLREIAPSARVKPWEIPVFVDDTGMKGVCDQDASEEVDEDGSTVSVRYRFLPINFGQKPRNEVDYINARSEMLFDLADHLAFDRLNLGGMGKEAFERLVKQARQIRYALDGRGHRVAEPKKDMKKRLGRSPDTVDAVSLCYYKPADGTFKVEKSHLPPVKPLPPPPVRGPGNPSESRSRYYRR